MNFFRRLWNLFKTDPFGETFTLAGIGYFTSIPLIPEISAGYGIEQLWPVALYSMGVSAILFKGVEHSVQMFKTKNIIREKVEEWI